MAALEVSGQLNKVNCQTRGCFVAYAWMIGTHETEHNMALDEERRCRP
jgi:hypothetical protein